MKFLSFFSISYLITILYDYIKRKLKDKKSKKSPTPIEDINISPIKKETKDSSVSYNFLEQDQLKEEEYDPNRNKRSRLNSDTIYLKLNNYYDHSDFIFIAESGLDGDPVYGYVGDPRMLNTHNIIYVELIRGI